jgi:hypothetical protein
MTEERHETGHAKVYIDWRFIEQLLQLPEGVQVAGIYEYAPIAGMVIHLIGDALPHPRRNEEPETIWPTFHYEPRGDGQRMLVSIDLELPSPNADTER